jgi:hypothetical protein
MNATITAPSFTGKIGISKHAIDEAVKDFRIDRKDAEEWIRSNLRKSRFISDIISQEGRPSRLYAYQRVALILADSEDFVFTVYPQNTPDSRLHSKVETLILRELRKAERIERAAIRRASVEKARLAVEKARCELAMTVTPSKSVIAANTAKIAQINESISQLDRQVLEAKRTKSSIAKALAAYL